MHVFLESKHELLGSVDFNHDLLLEVCELLLPLIWHLLFQWIVTGCPFLPLRQVVCDVIDDAIEILDQTLGRVK